MNSEQLPPWKLIFHLFFLNLCRNSKSTFPFPASLFQSISFSWEPCYLSTCLWQQSPKLSFNLPCWEVKGLHWVYCSLLFTCNLDSFSVLSKVCLIKLWVVDFRWLLITMTEVNRSLLIRGSEHRKKSKNDCNYVKSCRTNSNEK